MSLAKNTKLRKEILKRWKELEKRPADVIRDAR